MTMRSIVLLSVGVHVAALLFGQFGLQQLFIDREVAAQIIPVEIVRVSSKTVAPPAEPENLPEPPTPPAPPEQQVAAADPSPPPEPLPPEPAVAPEPPAPPEPDIVAAPPEPVAQPEPPPVVKARPKAKPQPPVRRQFANVLKDLAVIEQPPLRQLPQLPVSQTLAPLPADPVPVAPAISRVASVAEVDALAAIVRRQIEPCWNPPIGAVEAEDLIVRLLVRVDRAGYVREAQILGAGRMALNPFFEAAADSARRAVLNDRCRPLSLPLDRYELWKELELTFNPSDMLG